MKKKHREDDSISTKAESKAEFFSFPKKQSAFRNGFFVGIGGNGEGGGALENMMLEQRVHFTE